MKKYLPIIKEVLEESETSRNDDLVLAYRVFEKIDSQIVTMNLGAVLRRIKDKQIPSFDTCTRLSRKLKQENPDLRGSQYNDRMNFKQQKCKQDLGYENNE